MEIIIAQGCVTSVVHGPESEQASTARQIASFLPLPSLLDGARVLHDQDENMTALQLPTHAGPVLLVMPITEECQYVIIFEGETGRRIIGTVRREDRRTRQPLRQVAYRVAEFLRSRALV
ncbi:hypothetical protein [Streptacidiphilus anmyonensis]|uniref:hypothetical protein n=1 Tax=Streptacidiphilus anmyonensis TaxID=405782 RepID=UPI0005AB3AC9|nr:hypothetical protein [Streptacidiphilus anmyonensis]